MFCEGGVGIGGGGGGGGMMVGGLCRLIIVPAEGGRGLEAISEACPRERCGCWLSLGVLGTALYEGFVVGIGWCCRMIWITSFA